MRDFNKSPALVRWVVEGTIPVLGATTLLLAGCGSSSSKQAKSANCISTPVFSPFYMGSSTHKGVIVEVPPLDSHAVGLDVGFQTPSGEWKDSDPVSPSFLRNENNNVVVGIEDGGVKFRFAEIFTRGSGHGRPALGNVQFSAQTTDKAQSWDTVKTQGAQPIWSQNPTALPNC